MKRYRSKSTKGNPGLSGVHLFRALHPAVYLFKLKGTVTVPVDSDEAAVVAAAMESDKVKKATEGMSVVKTILVRNKLVNLIVKPAK